MGGVGVPLAQRILIAVGIYMEVANRYVPPYR